jgi:hypothetical protein
MMKLTRAKAAFASMLILVGGSAFACGQTPDYNPTCGYTQGDCGISNGGGAEQNSQQQAPAQPASGGGSDDSPCPAGSWDAGSPHC